MNDDLSRQSFLGANSERILSACKIGIVGLSGGGSHIVQQAAHVGVGRYILVDPKSMAKKHLHRIVGATIDDVRQQIPKAEIAERVIKEIRPDAEIDAFVSTWQERQLFLRDCNAIFGCVDSYSEREQLERFCRRFLIPYIDIGMDVFESGVNASHICGQVVMSSPGHPCLRCMAVITDDRLREEAATYGAAGPKPQVIWPNGVLASTAIGLLMQMVTPWHPLSGASAYLEYNGNRNILGPSPRMEYVANLSCDHFSITEVGDPFFSLEDTRHGKAAD